MRADLHKAIREHMRQMIVRARDAGRGMTAVVSDARGDLLGPDWLADVADRFVGADKDGNDAIVARASQIRTSGLVLTVADLIALRLVNGATKRICESQRSIYVTDQTERARIYNAMTNPQWQIAAHVDEHELDLLGELPIEGQTRAEAIGAISQEWREQFRFGVVRALVGTKGGFKVGIQMLARNINSAFDRWVRRMEAFAAMAALTALNASAREFARAFMPPAGRMAGVI